MPSMRIAGIAAGMALVCFAMRLPFIGSLPIFMDEAIFLRWAQVIADHPSFLYLAPLSDPKPPVHFGLLALVVNLGTDPVVAGRVLSAAVGALTVFFGALLAAHLAGGRAAVAAAVLLTVSPYLAFHQRLATADALFVLEAVVAVWLALRFPRDGIWPIALVMALTMSTRQVTSFALWPVLLACVPRSRDAWKRFAGALVVALALWSPYLFLYPSRYKASPFKELRTRVLYHQAYGGTDTSTDKMQQNARTVSSWFRVYLTPPVFVAAAIAPVVLFGRKRRRTALLLLLWFALLTIPVVAFASVTYSRYVLGAVVPLLLLAACAIAVVSPRLGAVALVGLCVWPAHDLWIQATRWQDQRLTEQDRKQYITGWPAGGSTEEAIAWLRARADRGPIAVLTGDDWGLPADGVWVALANDPRVQLRTVENSILWDEKRSPSSAPAPIAGNVPIYRVFRGTPKDDIPHTERHDFTSSGQRVVVLQLR